MGWLLPLVAAASASADRDVPALTMGQVTTPAHSFIVEVDTAYTMPDLRQSALDTNALELELTYGVTDRLELDAALTTDPAQRSLLRLNQVELDARYRLVSDPFQLAPFVGVRPQLDEAAVGFTYGVATLKRVSSMLFGLDYTGTALATGTPRSFTHELDLGAYYTFGLNGVVGGSVVYDLPRQLFVTAIVGGRINRHLFLGVQPAAGLTGGAPALTVTIQLHFYFGSYLTPGLD
jgi:hypothetical protein